MQNFLFGTATSAHQIEGENIHSDWWNFEKEMTKGVSSARACNSYEMYEQDIQAMKTIGVNSYRFSIEWARIEPEEGKFNQEALDHYRKILLRLRDENIEPLVTLHHFTNPQWFYEKGEWIKEENLKYFQRYVEKVVNEYKDLIKYWITINEPNLYVASRFVLGVWFPFKANLSTAKKVYDNFVAAHKFTYKLIKNLIPDSIISASISHGNYKPAKNIFFPLNIIVVKLIEYLYNFYFWNRVSPDYVDFLGVNYYSIIKYTINPLAYKTGFISTIPDLYKRYENGETDIFPPFYPEDLYGSLKSLSKYHKDIIITENGVSTIDDQVRIEDLKIVFEQLNLMIKEKFPIKGYFHWSLIDNFEWGFAYNSKYGLYSIEPKTFKRIPKPSSNVYKKLIENFQKSSQY